MMAEKSKNASPLDLKRIKLELDDNDQLMIILEYNQLPSELYKYYLINDNSINSFQNEAVFISHPDNLNDTMEGNLKLWDFEELFKMMRVEGIKFDESQEKSKFFTEYYEKYFEYRGILCFTKSYQNNLFWPHYTNETGFCIEFNSELMTDSIKKNNSHIVSEHIYPISYGDLTKIDLLEHCAYKPSNDGIDKEFNSNIPSMYTVSIKDKLWEYEDEWRIVAKSRVSLNDKSFRKLKYDVASITRIFLAENFFSKNRFESEKEQPSIVKKFIFKKEHSDYKNILVFIGIIFNKFNDKTYIIGRIENGNVIEKNIEFQVIIRSYDIHSVKIEFQEFQVIRGKIN